MKREIFITLIYFICISDSFALEQHVDLVANSLDLEHKEINLLTDKMFLKINHEFTANKIKNNNQIPKANLIPALVSNSKNMTNYNEKSIKIVNSTTNLMNTRNSSRNNTIARSIEEFMMSFSLNFFSEIGDKSFVSIILVYNQISPLLLFIVSTFSELLMNLFSVVIGYELRLHPSIKKYCQFFGMIIAISFSLILIYEVFFEKEENEQTAECDSVEKETEKEHLKEKENENIISNNRNENNNMVEINEAVDIETDIDSHNNSFEKGKGNKDNNNSKSAKIGILMKIANIAWIIFLSELGDKSQITTIILSTEYHPFPIFLGTALAHILGILLSMTIGYIISNNLNKSILSSIGAVCFMYFGIQMGIDYYSQK
jgi:putative Ca2+/H+ antiporter (TMEM165/GDT1 family)